MSRERALLAALVEAARGVQPFPVDAPNLPKWKQISPDRLRDLYDAAHAAQEFLETKPPAKPDVLQLASKRGYQDSIGRWVRDPLGIVVLWSDVEAFLAQPAPEGLREAGFARNRPTGPRTMEGHALARNLRDRDPEVDWDAWIRSIEDAAYVAAAQSAVLAPFGVLNDEPGGAR